jgi:AraC-like DNA-binding protein
MLDLRIAQLWLAACRLGETLKSVATAAPSRRELDGAERHTVPTIEACLQGVVRIELARGHHDLAAHEAILLPPGVGHVHVPLRANSSAFGLGFMLGFADVEFKVAGKSWMVTIPEQPTRGLVESALRANALMRLHLVREALGGLDVESARPLAPMPEPTRRMWMYLRRERLSPIGSCDVLRASGLKPTRAKQLFREWFGMTPLPLLRRHRLEYARHLLAQGASVTEAALASGFRNRRHLTAACLTEYGVPPSNWKRASAER